MKGIRLISTGLAAIAGICIILLGCSNLPDEQGSNKSTGNLTGKVPSASVNTVHTYDLALPPRDATRSRDQMTYYYFTTTSVPSSYDLSTNMPPVGDQGAEGSCAGWSVVYAFKTSQEKEEEGWDASAASHQFSPSWVLNQLTPGPGGGYSAGDVMDLIVKKGCDTLDHFPYTGKDKSIQPSAKSMAFAKRYRAYSWGYVWPSVDNIRKGLASGRAIVLGFEVYEDFVYLSSPNNMVYDEVSGSCYGNHGVCLVGYDDNKQAFKFINSWGTNWGENGYGYISYSLIGYNGPVNSHAYYMIDDYNLNAIYVSGSGSDANTGAKTSPKKSLQSSLDYAAFVDITNIYISQDVYSESIMITNSRLNLSGGWDGSFSAKNGYTILDGSSFSSPARALFTISNVSGVNLDGFVIRNNKSGYSVGGLDIENASYCRFTNTIVSNNSGSIVGGVYIANCCSYGNIFNFTIRRNSGFNCGGLKVNNAAYFNLYGDIYENSAYGSAVEVNAGYCTFLANVHNNSATCFGGIWVYNTSYCVTFLGNILNNTAYPSGVGGIKVPNGRNISVLGTVSGNTPNNIVYY